MGGGEARTGQCEEWTSKVETRSPTSGRDWGAAMQSLPVWTGNQVK